MNSLTDVHIKLDEPGSSLVYPGPRQPVTEELALIGELTALAAPITRDDFRVKCGNRYWRGRRGVAVDGVWVRFRLIEESAPTLERLPSPMPRPIKDVLLSPTFSKGGLIHIAGAPGTGKTTTGSATVVSRLLAYGGVAYTAEDPPELPLNGWHGSGYCTQTDVASDWNEAMRTILRSQPARTAVMVYVGEVRDPDTARAMLRAASNGMLVISTGFGSDLISGIDTFFQLIGRESAASFASVLKLVLFQNIDERRRFTVQALVSDPRRPNVAAIIREGKLAQLGTEIEYQAQMLRNGQPLLERSAPCN